MNTVVYEYSPDIEGYAFVGTRPSRGSVFDLLFQHKPLLKEWPRVEVRLDRSAPRHGDFPWFPAVAAPVFSQRALDVLRGLIGPNAEPLPLVCGEQMLYLINTLDIVDCLDHSKAVVSYYDDGTPRRVVCYAFADDRIRDKHLFKVPESCNVDTLVSEQFKKTVEQNALKGLTFEAVT